MEPQFLRQNLKNARYKKNTGAMQRFKTGQKFFFSYILVRKMAKCYFFLLFLNS